MLSETGASSPEPNGLQFDHAEFENAAAPDAVVCAGCRRPIADQYYEINGTIFCGPCRQVVEAQIWSGSKLGRFARAVVFGSLAALLGTVLYVTFKVLSPNFDISLIAILIGYMVGKMVRKGSRNLGGFPYQLLAMFLTYASLAMTYFIVGVIFLFQNDGPPKKPPEPNAPVVANAPDPDQVKAAPDQAAKMPPRPAGARPTPTFAEVAHLVLMILGYAFAKPFFVIKTSPIMVAFVGFALWEAWKFNAPLKIVFTGPYQLGDPGPLQQGTPGHA